MISNFQEPFGEATVNNLPDNTPAPEPTNDMDVTLKSPIRPVNPSADAAPRPGLLARAMQQDAPQPAPTAEPAAEGHDANPAQALEALRSKMEVVATEFGQGKINRAQFNAIYGRYSEQRTIIEKLMQRNPSSDAWKHAAAPGHTSFLRDHFESKLLFYLVYQHNIPTPLMMGGSQQPSMDRISGVLKSLWGMTNRPKGGLARKEMGNGQWLVLALGEYAVTMVLFQLEPSTEQTNLVRDLHGDFERANRRALERGTRSLDRFVFPQRALTEKTFS
jgi:hypothetical protein